METDKERKVNSFLGLDVYKRAFAASKEILFTLIPKLPIEEKYGLADQMRRASKAIPAIIAEGYAKKNQEKGFQKYLVDAMGEANEMMVHLSYSLEYLPKERICINRLIEEYNIVGKQLYRLKENWKQFK